MKITALLLLISSICFAQTEVNVAYKYRFIPTELPSGQFNAKGRTYITIEATDTATYVFKWTKEKKYADPVATPVQLEAEAFTSQSGTHAVSGGRGATSAGSYLSFTKNFGPVGLIKASINYAKPSGSTTLSVRLGSATGAEICKIQVPFTGAWTTYKTSDFFMLSAPLKGTQTIYVVFTNANDMDLNWIKFN